MAKHEKITVMLAATKAGRVPVAGFATASPTSQSLPVMMLTRDVMYPEIFVSRTLKQGCPLL